MKKERKLSGHDFASHESKLEGGGMYCGSEGASFAFVEQKQYPQKQYHLKISGEIE